MLLDQTSECVEIESQNLNISRGAQVDVHLVLEEDGSVVNHRARPKHIDEECVAFKLGRDMHVTLLDKVDLLNGVLHFEHAHVLCKRLGFQAEDQVEQNINVRLVEVFNTLNHAL